MSPRIKIARRLLEKALYDLERPHPFAFERVGFFSCRQISGGRRPLILAYDYHSVADGYYVEDPTCGARIGGVAIQEAMQRVLDEGSAQLWVHTHGRDLPVRPSPTDCAEGPRVVRALSNVNHDLFHGWAVISESAVSGQIASAAGLVELNDLVVVGWPMKISRIYGEERVPKIDLDSLHGRQSFLGPRSKQIIEGVKLGIVGLGGGGSHINQQLAHLGFKSVVYADADRIALSNLNRLVGATRRDVRRSAFKTEIASRLFRSLHRDAELDDEPLIWEDKTDSLGDCDIIFGCVDSFACRRDLEHFCRSRMIPLIDIGMKVDQESRSSPQMFGQVAVSMHGYHCLRCLNIVTERNLAEEAADYGAGPQPQVVWPNGVLASCSVGLAVQMLTGWSKSGAPPQRIDFRGFEQTLRPSNLLEVLKDIGCDHFESLDLGDPKLRSL